MTVASLVLTIGEPTAPVGVMVSILRVDRVMVVGSVAVIVSVIVTVSSPPPIITPVVLSTPDVMITLEFEPGGKHFGQQGNETSVCSGGSNGPP